MKKFGFVIPVIFALAVFLAAGAGGTALGSRGAEGQGGKDERQDAGCTMQYAGCGIHDGKDAFIAGHAAGNAHQVVASETRKAAAGVGEPRQGSGAVAPVKPEVEQKMKKLHVPFIANEGQADEQVKYYANTFAGSVFVTKDGEIVYSLPSGLSARASQESGRDVPAGASLSAVGTSQESGRGHEAGGLGGGGAEGQGGKAGWYEQSPLVRAESAFVANGYSPFFRVDNVDCPPERLFAKSLLAAYLPGLRKETTQRVVSTMPANDNLHSAFQNPKSPIRNVAIKEHLVGGNIGEIRGEATSATTVSYFKGNDPSQWKTNLATVELVNLGEVYEGIDLRLKAYGNNVEKLFCVKPGANPAQIKISLSGVKECGIENPNSPIQNPKLQINPAGELVAETGLGAVKFTKPVAYQEIDGKRVEVACEYAIAEGGTSLEFGFWNLDWFPYSEINNLRFSQSARQNPNFAIQNLQSTTHNTQHTTHNTTYL